MIRTYAPADHDALIDLFARAGVDSPSGELWRHLPSEQMVYLAPYIEHCPDTLFLAEIDGDLVGYLTGCPDSALLPGEDELLTQAITRHKVMLRPRSMPFFGRSLIDMAKHVRDWPEKAVGPVTEKKSGVRDIDAVLEGLGHVKVISRAVGDFELATRSVLAVAVQPSSAHSGLGFPMEGGTSAR